MSTLAQLCDLMALIRKQPRTLGELADVLGRADHRIATAVHHLHAEGHVYIAGRRFRPGATNPAKVYAWQPSLFERPDTPEATIPELVSP